MVKIKTKKGMTLPQLIEWAWDNGIKNKRYVSKNRYIVTFDKIGFLESATLPLDETFTVEVEEEITEDTKLDLIERFIGGTDCVCYTSQRATIKECLKRSPRDCTTTHFYIETDNRELILIWRDGKLI